MPVSIFYHSDFLKHNTGKNHPENKKRLLACISALKKSSFSTSLIWKIPKAATEKQIQWIHSINHINKIKNICESGGGYLDPDTPISNLSYEIGLLSAGAWLNGIDEIINKNNYAFILSRPPGHHAESNKAMGFCLFSNAALAATYALKKNKINKVAIFDWDVHHGNGTQEIIQNKKNIAYCSIHQFPFYPGTGTHLEKDINNNIKNIPIPSNLSQIEYLKKFDHDVIPFLKNFNPDLLIISAGFDAHKNDPLSNMNLDENDFSYMIRQCKKIQTKIILGLEGGYDLLALKKCVIAVTKELLV